MGAGSMRPLLIAALAFAPQYLIATDDRGQVIERICATSPATCAAAITAIGRGWVMPELRGRHLYCEPADCFTPAAQCIAGFNCRHE